MTRLKPMAQSMKEGGVQLTRLEFPRTEIQLFGNTAILYYTYVMEQRLGDQAAIDAGRGTEIFVRRDGKWVDVGWHLDQGAFQRKNECGSGSASRSPSPVQRLPDRRSDRPARLAEITDLGYKVALLRFMNWTL
jgi:hypothetical protein